MSKLDQQRSNMSPQASKPVIKEKITRKGKLSGSKRRMLKATKDWKPNVSPQLREAYNARTEWTMKVIPKLKKE